MVLLVLRIPIDLLIWIEEREREEKEAKEEDQKAEEERVAARDRRMELHNGGNHAASAFVRAERMYKKAQEKRTRTQARHRRLDKRVLPAMKSIAAALNEFVENKRGIGEHAAEATMSKAPISAKHNPFYGQSFNGNDTMRLLHPNNVKLVFEAVENAQGGAVTEEIKAQYQKHKKCWEIFGEIAPLLRTTRKLTSDEEKQLLDLVEAFLSAYESLGTSITIKAHMLVHLLLFLKEYGPPGLFAEDSIESLHAVVNELGRSYAALDHAKKIKQTLLALKGERK